MKARALVRDTLGDVASVMFMDVVVDDRRHAELQRADALLSWVIGSELGDDDWPALTAGRARPVRQGRIGPPHRPS